MMESCSHRTAQCDQSGTIAVPGLLGMLPEGLTPWAEGLVVARSGCKVFMRVAMCDSKGSVSREPKLQEGGQREHTCCGVQAGRHPQLDKLT